MFYLMFNVRTSINFYAHENIIIYKTKGCNFKILNGGNSKLIHSTEHKCTQNYSINSFKLV